MARGFLSGLVWGGIVAVGAAAGVSLLVPMGPPPDTVQSMPETEAPVDTAVPDPAVAPSAESAVSRADPVSEPAQPESVPNSGTVADTDPAARPEVGGSVAELAPPVINDGGEVVAQPAMPQAAMDATVSEAMPETQAADAVPPGETSISTDPAQPPAPNVLAQDVETPVAPPPAQESDPEPQTTSGVDGGTDANADVQPETDDRIAALPQAGVGDDSATPAQDTAPEPAMETTEPMGPPPVELWAQSFENPGDKPLMAIVLIDDAQSVGAEALAAFPSPMTIAVDPRLPDAPERMARHRAAGFEVLALADLPEDAAPQDAEMAMGAILSRVPESVGVLEGVETGIQGNRPLADQVAAILRDRGYGLVTQDNGLNTVPKLAARDGVPTAVVFRDFDGADQTPTVMRRFLDQAAFRAGQVGGVVMLGRVRPDTISALLVWGLQDRASRVTLAPVSAVLSTTPPAGQ